ncbi:MAG: DUF542 domain-containing protein [Gemmatimonadaceae bacterium]|nr:DUF542 domain-containing protein [Gemmatimonadaceae bacterium]
MTASTTGATLGERTVGDIAAALPEANSVFHAFDIDYCCNGGMTLQEAVELAGADMNAVTKALTALNGSKEAGIASSVPTPATMSNDELIEHIRSRYHAAHRAALPQLVALSRKVEKVHEKNPKVPAGLGDTLERIGGLLDQHMAREEESLFPAMRQAGGGLDSMIGELRHEHEDQGKLVHEIERLTDKFNLPAEACGSWNMLYVKTAELTKDLMDHIHIENNVLFPRFAGKA